MKSITVLGALTAIALTSSVQANQDVSGFYIGGGVGSTHANFSSDSHSYTPSTDGASLKLIGGYQFNRIVAIEAQYTSYGDIKIPVAATYKWEPTTVSLAANLGYTFDNGLRPFATVGLSSVDLNQNMTSNLDNTGTAFRFGAGLEYTPAALAGVSFRAGYEGDAFTIDTQSSSIDDVNVVVGSLYVAASYKF
ncbi:porin family protein [Moritella sp. 24]|uniref:porin family protein n=1 Tax=Moritella sp. 24 TaxID=2746230 RepID=UPI001BA95616|nr:porin family protein [Moritella sp. 24]QUM76516.1 porin family protein [Moritella sp. 24]